MNPKEWKEFLKQFSPNVVEIAKEVYELCSSILLPELKVWLDSADKMVTFGSEKTMKGEVCYIKPLKDSVNLGFFHGVKLKDPQKLLQGTGKSLRHVKLKNLELVKKKELRELIQEAFQEHKNRNS